MCKRSISNATLVLIACYSKCIVYRHIHTSTSTSFIITGRILEFPDSTNVQGNIRKCEGKSTVHHLYQFCGGSVYTEEEEEDGEIGVLAVFRQSL